MKDSIDSEMTCAHRDRQTDKRSDQKMGSWHVYPDLARLSDAFGDHPTIQV